MAKYVNIDIIEKYIKDNYSQGEVYFAFIDFLNWLDAEPESDVVGGEFLCEQKNI